MSSLRNVVRLLLTLGNDGALADKIRVVVNRVGAEPDITIKEAEETIGKPIYWQVPCDDRAMADARNHGEPLVQHAPKSKVLQSFAALAQTLSGKEAPAPREKSSRWALFSRR